MENKEILQKAIQKAINNGFLNLKEKCFYILDITDSEFKLCNDFGMGVYNALELNIYKTIFSHDFAKAFWGEDEVCIICGTDCEKYMHLHSCTDDNICVKAYEFHLQQMVIEKEPLKYLEKFL